MFDGKSERRMPIDVGQCEAGTTREELVDDVRVVAHRGKH